MKKHRRVTAGMIYCANEPLFIDRMRPEDFNALVEFVKDNKREDCRECIFFYRRLDKTKNEYVFSCTINRTAEIDELGTVPGSCPLREEGEKWRRSTKSSTD